MTPRATPMSPADRRKAIVAAVIPLVIESGEAPSTREIATAAGIAEGTIFRVFDGLPELMEEVAREALNPRNGRELLVEALVGVDDLTERVRIAADALMRQMHDGMQIMIALRRHLGTRWPGRPGADQVRAEKARTAHRGRHEPPPGPPAFVVEANRELVVLLTELFEPHRDQLRFSPEKAALLMRSLVFGARHPGMDQEFQLTADEIATTMVSGVLLPEEDA